MKRAQKEALEFSKRLAMDARPLLWIVTIGGFLLGFYAIYRGFVGTLPWIATMVSAVWASYGTICAFYLNMAKSDHKEGAITFEAAKANNFSKPINNTYEEGQI